MRVSVELEDSDFVNVAVAVLRQEGRLVVEPEIADVKITERRPPPGIRMDWVPRAPGDGHFAVSVLLPAPVTVRRLASALRRLVASSDPGPPNSQRLGVQRYR
jgi:hypothetical protein